MSAADPALDDPALERVLRLSVTLFACREVPVRDALRVARLTRAALPWLSDVQRARAAAIAALRLVHGGLSHASAARLVALSSGADDGLRAALAGELGVVS